MKKLKIAITGHTSGIGKEIFEKLDAEVVGFSRSNGFDIDDPSSRARLLEQIQNCDVFINNARGNGFSQTQLLMETFEKWRMLDKLIISIGSRSGSNPLFLGQPHIYSIEKNALHTAIHQLQNCERKCRLTNLIFGMVNTPANQNNPRNYNQLPVTIASESVRYILSNSAEVANLEIWPR